MGRKYTDNALTTLASNIASNATTLTVSGGKGDLFPAVVGHGAPGSTPDYFVITMRNAAAQIEKIRVEQRAAGQDILGSAGFPLVRGYDGTTARAWNAGDLVDLRPDRTTLNDADDAARGANKAFGIRGAATSGLNFGYYGGTVLADGVLTNVADGAIALIASQTNFVERTPAGVVSANIAGFSADKIPLYQVVTDGTGITSFTDQRSEFSFTGRLAKSVAGAADVTLNRAESANEILELTGVLNGNINLILPAIKRAWIILNSTTGAFTVTAKTAAGTGVVVTQTQASVVFGDGTNIKQVNSGGGGAGITSGTWTPQINIGGGGGGGLAYALQNGTWIKIDRLMIAHYEIGLSAKGTNTGAVTVSGLPAVPAAPPGSNFVRFTTLATNWISLHLYPGIGTSVAAFAGNTAAAAANNTALQHTDLNNTSSFHGQLVYQT